MTSFQRKTICDICPWRRDLEDTQRLPKPYIERMEETCQEGFNAVYLCRRTPDAVCVGYLLSPDSLRNYYVSKALRTGRFDPGELVTDAPLFPSYEELAAANGLRIRHVDPERARLRGKRYVVRAGWPLRVSMRDWLAVLSDQL